MIRGFRAFFLSRALREKLLLVAFILIGVLWWGSAFTTRSRSFWREQRTTTVRLAEQMQWIKNKKEIEQTAEKTADQLDPTKTLNGNQLVTTVAQLANDAGLRNTATNGNTVTTTSGQFALHSVEFTIRNTEWETLTAFYKKLQERSPYIAVERFVLAATSPANPAQLTLSLKVVSVEIVR